MGKNKKIHVCHLVYSFDIGGLERVIANCISALDKDLYHHSIIALTSIGHLINEIDAKVDSYSLNKKNGNDLSSHLKLYRLLKQIKPDILHSYNLSTIEYHWLAPLVGIKLRLHAEHGRDSYDAKGTVTKYKLIRKILSPFIHHYIAVSKDLCDWLKKDVGIYTSKVKLISNGVNTDYYHPDQAKASLTQLFDGKFVFGHVARLHPIKNQEFLINSFKYACIQCKDFSQDCILLIVGDGPDKDKLEKQVALTKEIRDKVIFVGEKNNVRDYYKIFDVFVMSSIAEGIPLTLLEAMSMSTPHIVTAVGGINEVAIPSFTGVSIQSDDQAIYSSNMVELYKNKKQRDIFANNSRKRVVEHFSEKLMVESYHQLYQRVAD